VSTYLEVVLSLEQAEVSYPNEPL